MHTKTRTALGPATTREYSAEVIESLLSPVLSATNVSLLATFLPPFTSEASIELTPEDDTAVQVRLAVMSRSLWYALSEREYEEAQNGHMRPLRDLSHLTALPVRIHEHKATVKRDTLDAKGLETLISQVNSHSREHLNGVGIDGIQVLLAASNGVAQTRLLAWSPTRSDSIHPLVAILHSVARECFVDEPSRAILDQLHGYLDLGFPGESIPTMSTVRLFSSLSSRDQDPLLALLNDASAGWTVDIVNVDGIAGLLRGPLQKWVSTHAEVAWRHHPGQRELLDSIGVPEPQRTEVEHPLARLAQR